MAIEVHTTSVLPPPSNTGAVAGTNRTDRVILAAFQIPNAAGGAAGAAVTVAVAGMNLPPAYEVFVNPGQDAVPFVAQTSKTTSGFTITLNPRLAANTLAAGTLDVMVLG